MRRGPRTPRTCKRPGKPSSPGCDLVGVRDVDYHQGALGIRIGYVEQDVRPGSGHYFCGALTLDRSATAAQPVAAALVRLSYLSVRKLGVALRDSLRWERVVSRRAAPSVVEGRSKE